MSANAKDHFEMRLMSNMEYGIRLRKQGEFAASRAVLFSLIDAGEKLGEIYLNIAWSYDNQGLESDAREYYIKSLSFTLSEQDRFEAAFGLACTLRCLGDLIEAETLFIQLRTDYPCATEVIPFYVLCLISLGKKEQALQILLNFIIDNPPTPEIRAYQATLANYIKQGNLFPEQ